MTRAPLRNAILAAFLAALPCLAPVVARADVVRQAVWEHVTLETWDGWRYYDVAVEADTTDASLLITRGDGSQRVMVYEEVRTIWTAAGTEITGVVIPSDALIFEPDAPPEFAQPRPHHAAPPQLGAWQPRFRLALSANAGFGVSTGEWFSGLGNGPAFGGQVRAAVAPAVYLTAMLRDQAFDVTGLMPNFPGGYQVFDGTGHVRQFGVGFGVMLPRGYYREVVPYIEALFAAASHDLDYDERGDIGDYVETLNDEQLAGVLQFGLLVPLNRALACDVLADAPAH